MPNFIPYNQRQLMLLPLNIGEMIPEDHLVHGVSTIADQSSFLCLCSGYSQFAQDGGEVGE